MIQLYVLGFALFFGAMLLLDGLRLFAAPTLLAKLQSFQDLVIDFAFGAVVSSNTLVTGAGDFADEFLRGEWYA